MSKHVYYPKWYPSLLNVWTCFRSTLHSSELNHNIPMIEVSIFADYKPWRSIKYFATGSVVRSVSLIMRLSFHLVTYVGINCETSKLGEALRVCDRHVTRFLRIGHISLISCHLRRCAHAPWPLPFALRNIQTFNYGSVGYVTVLTRTSQTGLASSLIVIKTSLPEKPIGGRKKRMLAVS